MRCQEIGEGRGLYWVSERPLEPLLEQEHVEYIEPTFRCRLWAR
jgi:hypothetical protein